ncbi:MAG: PCRF domain-containing protein, partial [Planctomycetota bacterium JB042]
MEERMAATDFWSDPDAAQEVVQQLKRVKAILEPYHVVARLLEDADVLVELADEDGSDDATAEAARSVDALAQGCERLELDRK